MENVCNNQRIQYFDCARGIAMILVVASHIWAFTDIRYILFATTHNPTFFLVSGCLLVGSLTNKNRGGGGSTVKKSGISFDTVCSMGLYFG